MYSTGGKVIVAFRFLAFESCFDVKSSSENVSLVSSSASKMLQIFSHFAAGKFRLNVDKASAILLIFEDSGSGAAKMGNSGSSGPSVLPNKY